MTKAKKAAKVARETNAVDRKITHAAARHADNPIIKVVGAASEAADQPPLIALGIGTILVGALLRRPAMLRSGVRMLASEIVATGIKSAIKRSVDRTRPEKAVATGKHDFKKGEDRDHEESSFPSGHTAGAVAVARAVSRDAPGAAAPAYATAVTVAAVQMPRGKHYILDTVAGAAIGYAAEAATSAALRIAEAALASVVRRKPRP